MTENTIHFPSVSLAINPTVELYMHIRTVHSNSLLTMKSTVIAVGPLTFMIDHHRRSLARGTDVSAGRYLEVNRELRNFYHRFCSIGDGIISCPIFSQNSAIV
jgi:hypothetical protein